MANIHNKDICFVYVDNIETYNNSPKEDSYIYFVKNYGIFIGTRKVSNYVNRVSQLFNDENYISVDDASMLIAEAVSNLVGSSPEMLDTLYELGLAIAQDPNFAATMTEALANVDSMLQLKVDKENGKLLSTEDYTTEEKLKLESLYNYNDSSISSRAAALETSVGIIENKPAYNITNENLDDWNDAGEKADRLMDVAFTASYNDLIDTPQRLSDFNDDTSLNYRVDAIENKPAYNITDENLNDWNDAGEKVDRLTDVAFTASYNDLIDTPLNLSDFNDDTSLNYRVGSLEVSVGIIENKPAYNITELNIDDWNAKSGTVENLKRVAFTASYTDLVDTPQNLSDFNDDTSLNERIGVLETSVGIIENKPAYNITNENLDDWNDAGEKVDRLMDVAFTASYTDLVDTPLNLSDFNDDTSLNERMGVLENKTNILETSVGIIENKPAYNITDENITDWNDAGEKVDQLMEVAFTANYNDLVDTPLNLSDFNDDTSLNYRVEVLETSVGIIENKPAYNITDENLDDWNDAGEKVDQLMDVAFTSSYNDLIDTPLNLSDFNDDTSLNYRVDVLENKTEILETSVGIIENKPAYNITDENITDWNDAGEKVDRLMEVAFTANYNDLVDTPLNLSDFNDDTSLNERMGVLETSVGIIENKPAYNITDENLDDWNDAGEKADRLMDIAFTASYTDLVDTPLNLSDFNDDTSLNYRVEVLETSVGIIENKPAYDITIIDISNWNAKSASVDNLHPVAFSGNYEHLNHLPFIPENLSELNNDNYTVIDSSYVHTDNNYTTEEKEKLESLYNYDDSNLDNRISDLENAHYFDNDDEIDPIFMAHIASHITDGSVNYWNNKQEYIPDLQTIREGAALGATALQEHLSLLSLADGAEYDSTSHMIYLKHGDTRLNNPINAADFIKDGMVSDVSIHKGTGDNIELDCLIISFNTDAGHDNIEIPINRIFNPTNYYTKQDIEDKQYLLSETDPVFNAHIASHITDGSINYWNSKQDAIPNTSFEYWDAKQEYITDLQTIREGAALGATALLSFTETDPVFNAHIASHITDSSVNYWDAKQEAIPNTSFEYWDAKQDRLSDTSISYWNNKQESISDLQTIREGAALGATALQSETDPIFNAHISSHITDGSVNYWNTKQEAISDLQTIREGAALGATALLSFTETDPIFNAHIASNITDGSINYWNSKQDRLSDTSINYWNNKQETISDLLTIRDGAALGATALQEHQPIMTINNTSIIGEGNVNISGLPDVSTSDNDKILMVVNGEWQMVTPVFVYTGPDAPNNILGNNGDIYLQP